MKPIFGAFEFAGRQIFVPAYGVMVTLGFVVAIVMLVRRGKRRGFPPEPLLDLSWWILVTSLLGARLLYVLQHAGAFADLCFGTDSRDCLAPLRIWEGGLVFYGGVLGAGAFAYFFARRKGWSFAVLADAAAPALAVGHLIGRVGCFLAGCCYGQPCSGGGALCVRFPAGSVAHDHLTSGAGIVAAPPVIALQLIEAGGLALLCLGLLIWEKRQKAAGQVFAIYLGGYAALRFCLEFYRADDARQMVVSIALPPLARVLGLPAATPLLLSASQAVSVILLVFAVVALRRLRRRAGAIEAPKLRP